MLDDREIVSLFFRREESALSYTAEKYGGRLKKLSLGITGDRLTAEECENDTYLEAWNRISRGNYPPSVSGCMPLAERPEAQCAHCRAYSRTGGMYPRAG